MSFKDFLFNEKIDYLLSKKALIPLIIGLSPVLFYRQFKTVANEYLVNPILSNIESSLPGDLIFIAVLILILLDIARKYYREYISSTYNFGLFTSLILSYYLYFRLIDKEWIFTNTTFCNNLAYTDLIPIYWICLLFLMKSKKKNLKKQIKTTGFIPDVPIKKDSLDNYGRIGFAKAISQRILDTYPTENAFAIGITAPWGCGKTSFLNFIEIELEKKGNPENQIIIKFNSWQFDNTINLIDDFFNT